MAYRGGMARWIDLEASLPVLCQLFLWGDDDASLVEHGLTQMLRVSPAERKWSQKRNTGAETMELTGQPGICLVSFFSQPNLISCTWEFLCKVSLLTVCTVIRTPDMPPSNFGDGNTRTLLGEASESQR